jgi:hypothetical protein
MKNRGSCMSCNGREGGGGGIASGRLDGSKHGVTACGEILAGSDTMLRMGNTLGAKVQYMYMCGKVHGKVQDAPYTMGMYRKLDYISNLRHGFFLSSCVLSQSKVFTHYTYAQLCTLIVLSIFSHTIFKCTSFCLIISSKWKKRRLMFHFCATWLYM